jgi:hypothetical protein
MSKELVNFLERWLDRKPESATSLRVSAKSLGSLVTVSEHVSEEMQKDARFNLAKTINEDCSMWADQAQKETLFLVQWLDGEKPVATQHFKVSPLNEGIGGLPALDGSTESILSCLQAANIRKDEEMIKMMQAVSNLLVNQAEAQQATISHQNSLERENLRLKEAMIEKDEADSEWKKELVGIVKGFLPAVIQNTSKAPSSS